MRKFWEKELPLEGVEEISSGDMRAWERAGEGSVEKTPS